MKRIAYLLIVIALLFTAYRLGMNHVINDSVVTVSGQSVLIQIDGQIYQHNI